jgi:hypothetical protein
VHVRAPHRPRERLAFFGRKRFRHLDERVMARYLCRRQIGAQIGQRGL